MVDAADCTDTVLAAERDEARSLAADHRDDAGDTDTCPNLDRHHRVDWCAACETWAGRR